MKKTEETRAEEQALKAIEADKVQPKSIADEREPEMAEPGNALKPHAETSNPGHHTSSKS